MRIIYLHQYYNTDQMAGSTRSAEMARRFAKAGHEVHILTSERDHGTDGRPAGWRVTPVDGYTVHWYPVPYNNRMTVRQRIRAFAAFALRASTRASTLRADVVFATSTPLTIAVPAVYAAWRMSSPLVLEIRDLWPEIPIAIGALKGVVAIGLARGLERWAYRHSSSIVALSPGMRDGIVAAGVSPDRVSVIPNGCDLELFSVGADEVSRLRGTQAWLGNRPLVLYAGTVGRMNGVGYLVEAASAALAGRPEVCFVVLGDGAEVQQVRAAAEKAGVWQRNFFLLPPVAKREVATWFACADIVCSLFVDLPEMRANSANKFFDGLAAGRPVAINYLGWHADLLSQRGAGLLLPPGRPDAAATVLLDALADTAGLAALAQGARRLAEQEFDRDRLAERLLNVLSSARRPC